MSRTRVHTDAAGADVAIRADGLSKTYRSVFGRREVRALRPTELEVRRGEIVGILGPNGAGKTTLLKLLLGVVQPTSGSGFLFGRPITDPAARATLGYLPENHRFPGYLTGTQAMNIYGRMSGLNHKTLSERIPPLLERVDLAAWGDAKTQTYSKGMRQRLGLAQALLNEPELLVLDEPTDGVDPVGRRAIRDLLVELREKGTTILINSHILSEVEQVCGRVAILRDGSILRKGTIAEITGEKAAVRVGFEAPEPVAVADLPGRVAMEKGARVVIPDDQSLEGVNDVIDRLRSRGALIRFVEREHRTLEAGFLDILDAPEDGSDAN